MIKGEQRISVPEIIEIMSTTEPPYRNVRRLIYTASWDDIVSAAKTVKEKENSKLVYEGLDDFPMVLEMLPMEEMSPYHIGSTGIIMEGPGDSIGVRIRLQEMMSPIIRNSVQATWSWRDADITKGRHPDATEEQNAKLKRLTDMFVDDIRIAKKNNKAELRALIAEPEDATKDNITETLRLGFDLRDYNVKERLHYFNSSGELSDDEVRELEHVLPLLVKNMKNRTDVELSDVERTAGLPEDFVDRLLGYNDETDSVKPKRIDIYKLESALEPYVTRTFISHYPQDEWAVGVKRKYAKAENERLRKGFAQLEYEYFNATLTNFPPLVREVKTRLQKAWDESRPIWKSDWGPQPKYDPKA